MCIIELKKVFDKETTKTLESAMRKKGIPKLLLGSVMSLYEEAKARVRVESELSKGKNA